MEPTRYDPGAICWVELATGDVAHAKDFYAQLFGWSYRETPPGARSPYVIAELRGRPVAGISELGSAELGAPPHWFPYVAVANVDVSAARALDLGARLLAPPSDAAGAGRSAIVVDPTGAALRLWQPRELVGAAIVDEPGTFARGELHSRDLIAATRFYTALFEWTAEWDTANGAQRVTFRRRGRRVAGATQIRKDWEGIPPVWMIDFAVADTAAALVRIEAIGGLVIFEDEMAGWGRIAIVQDRQGATFMLTRPAARDAVAEAMSESVPAYSWLP